VLLHPKKLLAALSWLSSAVLHGCVPNTGRPDAGSARSEMKNISVSVQVPEPGTYVTKDFKHILVSISSTGTGRIDHKARNSLVHTPPPPTCL
jgi:hypothetical protein